MNRALFICIQFLLAYGFCNAQVSFVNSDYSNASYAIPALSHTPGAGSDRVLLFIAANEYETPPAIQVSSVTYGGQAMTFLTSEEVYTAAGDCWAEVEVYYLLESQINLASSSNFVVNYTGNSTSWRAMKHSAITFANVDQATPFGDIEKANNTSTNSIITSNALTGGDKDLLLSLVSGGNTTTYNPAPAAFTKIYSKAHNTHTYGASYMGMQCNSPIKPEYSSSSMNRQSLVALVINSNEPTTLPTVDLGNDTTLCNTDVITLDASTDDPDITYEWNDLSTSSTLVVRTPGVYSVTIDDGCETVTDEVTINFQDCECTLFMPNSFTPNGDNVNDDFGPAYDCNITEYSFTVFDRWGRVIFDTKDPSEKWTGYSSGNNEILPIGVYPFRLSYTNGSSGGEKELYGHVSLIR